MLRTWALFISVGKENKAPIRKRQKEEDKVLSRFLSLITMLLDTWYG